MAGSPTNPRPAASSPIPASDRHRRPIGLARWSPLLAAVVALLVLAAPAQASGIGGTLDVARRTPTQIDLFVADGFRFQDPNMTACTAASVMDMLNFVALGGTGGDAFDWRLSLSDTRQSQILAWEQAHDTMKASIGSDVHGWRNALNAFGWGAATLWEGQRIYDERMYGAYDTAVKDAVRAIASTRKPVAMLGWAGDHAQMITGYYGLAGDPFAMDDTGRYINTFTVGGFYIADPLRADAIVDRAVSYSTLQTTSNLRLRFRPYANQDSTLDDPYSPGIIAGWREWYGKYVLIVPLS